MMVLGFSSCIITAPGVMLRAGMLRYKRVTRQPGITLSVWTISVIIVCTLWTIRAQVFPDNDLRFPDALNKQSSFWDLSRSVVDLVTQRQIYVCLDCMVT